MSSATQAMQRIDAQLSHVWMVRTFLKHSDEAEDDEELCEVHRDLYDFALALGGPLSRGDAEAYLKQARKKFPRLRRALERFSEIQPDVSAHTNFVMARRSLATAVEQIGGILDQCSASSR